MLKCFPYCLFNIKPQRIFPIFSSRGFIIFSFISRSIINFELNFICDLRYRSNAFLFFPMYMEIQSFQYHLLKWQSFFFVLLNRLLSFVKWLYKCGSISGLYFFTLIYSPIFTSISYCLKAFCCRVLLILFLTLLL